jgi:ATP-dependent DNA helicase RecQ
MIQPLANIYGQTMPIDLVTRFLCGVISPRLVEYKARQLPGFGRLEAYPYKAVEKWAADHH